MTRSFEQLWAETLHHAKMHAPFYRESLRGLNISAPLTHAPVLDKRHCPSAIWIFSVSRANASWRS